MPIDRIDVKAEVEKAINAEWAAFAQRHPHLAAALDQQLLAEQAMTALADDPEYQQAIAQAQQMDNGIATLAALVLKFIRHWLTGG